MLNYTPLGVIIIVDVVVVTPQIEIIVEHFAKFAKFTAASIWFLLFSILANVIIISLLPTFFV